MSALKRKLLFVVNDAAFFLSHRLPIARAARDSGMAVFVAAPNSPACKVISEEGFRYLCFAMSRSGVHPVKEIYAVWRMFRLFRDVQPDIVHTVTVKPVLYGGLMARLAKVPALVSAVPGLGYLFIHNGWGARLLRELLLRIYRVALRHPNSRVIVQNPDDYALLRSNGIANDNAVVLIRGSGVDLDKYRPVEQKPGDALVVLASRMLWDKGVGDYVEAAKRLKASGSMARFALVGDIDPANPSCISKDQLHRWQKEGVVEWWGGRTDMPEVFAQAHIVCLPSYREGLPKVLIEAAACARPIVTTDVPGCREVVQSGVNGLLVPPRDPAALTAALQTLILDPAMRSAMGAAGRAKAEREFDIDSVVSETLATYHAVINS